MSSAVPRLSIVVPVFNEEEGIADVLRELADVLNEAKIGEWEGIVVDDGSRDKTAAIVEELRATIPQLRLLRFEKNCGQTAAFDAGFRAARGEFAAMMDGDGQNDPRDFPNLLAELEERGVDMMCGYRRKRNDSIVRKVSSRIANNVRNWATGETIRDVGCSIRVFRRVCLERLKLFEGMHRFFPTLVRMEGYSIAEMPVNHRPRAKGTSKYGVMNRLFKSIRDLLAVRWMQRRALRYKLMPERGER